MKWKYLIFSNFPYNIILSIAAWNIFVHFFNEKHVTLLSYGWEEYCLNKMPETKSLESMERLAPAGQLIKLSFRKHFSPPTHLSC